MDRPIRGLLRDLRPIALGLLWMAALVTVLFLNRKGLFTLLLGNLEGDGGAVSWLGSNREVLLPALLLAIAAALTVLSSPRVRRRWPKRGHRIQLALVGAAGLLGLAALTAAGWLPQALFALSGAFLLGLLVVLVLELPRRFAPPLSVEVLDRLADRDRLEVADARLKLQNDVRTTALQAIAGLAVLAGAFLAFQQLSEDRHQAAANRDLTRQGQASERFTRAIDQLTSDRLEVQLGGIYGLEQVARQAPDNRRAVTEVLVAYLHRRASRPAKPTSGSKVELRVRAPDIQAALTVLGRREVDPLHDPSLDLRRLDLSYAELSGADLRDADLRGTDFSGAQLVDVQGRGADFSGANLRGADLEVAQLSYASLRGANLRGANLNSANLSDHSNTDPRDKGLNDWVRRGLANVPGADLSGADLRGADLAYADLHDATADQRTQWPSGFDWRAAGILTNWPPNGP